MIDLYSLNFLRIHGHNAIIYTMISIDEIREKLKVLKGNRAIRRVILFGSYARGDVSRRSDMDLAVIMDDQRQSKP